MNDNGFTALRLLGAYLVIITHSNVLLRAEPDSLTKLGLPQWSELGVSAFFAVSGYLICKALQRNSDPISYLRNRALRIFPAFFVLLVFTVFFVGPFFSNKSYWENGVPLSYFSNLSLYQLSPYLPGVFQNNPVKVVNGSLWTLVYEVTCYLLLLAISWAGGLNRRCLFLVFAAFYVMHMSDVVATDASFLGVEAFQFWRLSIFFWGGALLATMPLSANWGLWFGAVVVAVAPFVIFSDSQDWHEKEWAFKLLFPFILIFLAERARKLAFLNRFDISYGVYI